MASSLSGYCVLDLTDEKGMFCAKLLSDMGADVIRVEKPGSGDRQSPLFCYLNAGKRSITLNLEDQTGRDVFKHLIKTAHVVLESGAPGYMDSLRLSYSELSHVNPGVVMASISDFGQSGPYKNYKSCDLVVAALGGQMYVSGESGTSLLKPFGPQAYYTACLFAANGVLLALWEGHKTGMGQHIDVSAMECVAATLDHVLVRYFHEGVVAERQGSQYWNNAFRIFPCQDGYILLSLFYHWATLVEWLEAEGMADDLTDKKWLNREECNQHLDHIIEVLTKWTKSHTVAELVEKGQLMRFPWAGVTSIAELVRSPQLAARNFFVSVECRDSGKILMCPGSPVKPSRSPWEPGDKVPDLGEHNQELYGELGFSAEEMQKLSEQGVI